MQGKVFKENLVPLNIKILFIYKNSRVFLCYTINGTGEDDLNGSQVEHILFDITHMWQTEKESK